MQANVSRADKIYDSSMPIFEKAWELYPDYNTICSDDHENAILYILDKMDDEYKLTEDERDKLNDMISGGLA